MILYKVPFEQPLLTVAMFSKSSLALARDIVIDIVLISNAVAASTTAKTSFTSETIIWVYSSAAV